MGPFYLNFFMPQRVLLVDGAPLVTLTGDQNVVLLVEEHGALSLIGMDSVNPDLGPFSIGRAALMSWPTTISQRMREVLLLAPKVKSFIEQ